MYEVPLNYDGNIAQRRVWVPPALPPSSLTLTHVAG